MLVNGKPGNLISIRDRGLLYGDGVFRTMRVSQGKIQHWLLHYQKLQHDCNALGIVCPDIGLLAAESDELLALHPEGVAKLIVTRGQGKRGYAPPSCAATTHLWDMSPLPDYPAGWTTNGIKAQLCQLRLSHQPRLAGIKHLNRLENVLAAAELHEVDIVEGLMMDARDNVIGGTRSNLFLVSQAALITPDLLRCGVAGVQRDRVIAWAEQHGMPLHIRNIRADEVLHADELFVVNSVIGIWPIRELGQRCWSTFPIAAKIRHDLDEQWT